VRSGDHCCLLTPMLVPGLVIVRLRVVVLAVGLASLCWLMLAGAASAAPASKVYVAMGDSVTQLGSSSGQRYPERFCAFLRQAGAADTLRNIGSSGETSSSILGAQRASALQIIDDASTDATVLTIDIGGNDVLNAANCNFRSSAFVLDNCQPTLQIFSQNFESLLDALAGALASDPGAEQVIVMAYYNPWSGRVGQEIAAANATLVLLGSDGQIDCAGQGTSLGLNDRLACVGAQHGAKLADAYPAFIGTGLSGSRTRSIPTMPATRRSRSSSPPRSGRGQTRLPQRSPCPPPSVSTPRRRRERALATRSAPATTRTPIQASAVPLCRARPLRSARPPLPAPRPTTPATPHAPRSGSSSRARESSFAVSSGGWTPSTSPPDLATPG
jgi:lysophospholipase L1-like esterase